jgi:hypothetical protein
MISLFQRLRFWLRRGRNEQDLGDELQFHLQEEAEERQAAGLTDVKARYAARCDIGNLTLIEEEARTVWTWTWLEQLLQDCRYGLRAIAANGTFSTLAILSLALGIGAKTPITILSRRSRSRSERG